jgi:hypothetical protein
MIAHYKAMHGEIPTVESINLLRVEELNEADAEMLAIGLETLASDGAQEGSGNHPSITGNSERCASRSVAMHAWQVFDSMLV